MKPSGYQCSSCCVEVFSSLSLSLSLSLSRRIQTAHRTCSIWLGVGDAQIKQFRLFEYSSSTANVSKWSTVHRSYT